MNVAVKARKILGPMSSFKLLDTLPDSLAGKVDLANSGALIGIYENNANSSEDCVVITEKEIHVVSDESSCVVRFDDMSEVKTPDNKNKCDALEVSLKSGEIIMVPVRNGSGRFKDIFEFLRFIDRVIPMGKPPALPVDS